MTIIKKGYVMRQNKKNQDKFLFYKQNQNKIRKKKRDNDLFRAIFLFIQINVSDQFDTESSRDLDENELTSFVISLKTEHCQYHSYYSLGLFDLAR